MSCSEELKKRIRTDLLYLAGGSLTTLTVEKCGPILARLTERYGLDCVQEVLYEQIDKGRKIA